MKLTLRTALSFAAAALAGGALLMSCQDKNEITEEPVQLAAPELAAVDVTTSSFMVIWDAVENADSYVYTLNGGEEESTTYTSAEFTELSSGNYTVKVKAVSEDPAFLDSEWATIDVSVKEPGQLDAPVLKVENQTLTSFTVTWNAIENAGSYAYTLNGGAEQTTESTSAEFTSLAPGKYTVKVKAVAADENFKDSGWGSVEVTIEEPKPLDAPELSVANKTYTSFTVTWSAVTNADAYTYTLDDGEEMTTASTSIEFKDLSAGDYTVKVKATSKNEAYLDSDWASITVTLEEPVEETFTLDVFLKESDQYTKYNSAWFAATGSGVSAVKYMLMRDNTYSDDDIITMLQQDTQGVYSFGTDDLSTLNSGETVSSGFIQLDAETTYEYDFYVTFVSGKSELYREKITTEAAPAPSADLAQWLGTWNISSDKVLRWTPGEDNYVYPNVVDGQKTATITIESDPSVENGVIITGLSAIPTDVFGMAVPAYGTVVDGQLILQNCEIIWNVNYQDGSTGTLCWLTSSQGNLTTADITVYTLTMGSDNVVTGTPYSADSSYEAYVIKDNGGVSVYTSSADSFAGTWTLTKATANTLTSAKPYSRQYEIKNFEYTVRYPASAKSFIR